MGKIFCLMGKSSSGKDTIFNEIKNQLSNQLIPIVSYTTRPMRKGEIQGKEYHFISKEQLSTFSDQNKIIEQRVYQTVDGPWYYATIDDGQIDLRQYYIMIVTLEAYQSLVSYFGEALVMPIYIEVEDGIRLERALRRERQQPYPRYEELCRRFLADQRDFSEEKLEQAKIKKRYINTDVNDCIEQIKEIILKEMD